MDAEGQPATSASILTNAYCEPRWVVSGLNGILLVGACVAFAAAIATLLIIRGPRLLESGAGEAEALTSEPELSPVAA